MSRFVQTQTAPGGQYVKQCRYCGRIWWMDGGRTVGFVVAGADAHIDMCRDRTPAERQAQNHKDERRWAAHPPETARIVNDPDHPGLANGEDGG